MEVVELCSSCYVRYMFDNFFKHIDIDPKNAHVLDGNAPDLVAECAEYERKIAAAGGIELFVGGQLKMFISVLYTLHYFRYWT